MGNNHEEDEEDEEAMVTPADAAVEEKAVVVIVFNAHITQLAVFSEVGLKQLRKAKTGWAGENILLYYVAK